jgi:hypothetical protein
MVTADSERIAAKSQYAVRYISHMQNMYNMQNHVNKCIFCIFFHMSMFFMSILHILHTSTKYAEQSRALLDTLRIHQFNNSRAHIVLYATLLIGHTQHKGHMRVSEIAADQSQRHGVYPPAWDIWWDVSAQDG